MVSLNNNDRHNNLPDLIHRRDSGPDSDSSFPSQSNSNGNRQLFCWNSEHETELIGDRHYSSHIDPEYSGLTNLSGNNEKELFLRSDSSNTALIPLSSSGMLH